jgi:hypothetical protein
MPTPHSVFVFFVDGMPSELMDDMLQTGWTACAEISGRHGPEYAAIES